MRQHSGGSEVIKTLVILGDFIILNAMLLCFFKLTPALIPPFFSENPRVIFLTANFAMIVSQYFFPTIIHYRQVNFETLFAHILKLSFTQAFLMFIFLRIISDGGGMFKFMFIFGASLFTILFIFRFLERFILKQYRKMGGNTRNVLLIGSDPANLTLYQDLISDPSTGYIVKGYYSDEKMEGCPESLQWLGNIAAFNEIMDKDRDATKESTDGKNYTSQNVGIDDIFCCLSHDDSDEIIRVMHFCDNNLIHFFYVPRMLGNFRLNLKPERFGNISLFTNHREPLTYAGNRFIKRTFDIVVSLIVCIFLLPFIPIIALIIKVQSPGPVFFKQSRTGLNGKTFQCYKFRSMHINNKADLAQATLDDPRKYPFGQFMRRTNLDEFPQFFNVLIGDMSIVGPRPHMLYHTEIYSKLIDKYMVRHFSRPGITGYAQVSGFRGETRELWQMEERIRRDIWYIENWTFWLDIKIIMKTAASLFLPDEKAY